MAGMAVTDPPEQTWTVWQSDGGCDLTLLPDDARGDHNRTLLPPGATRRYTFGAAGGD